jgi:hypothetical protein
MTIVCDPPPLQLDFCLRPKVGRLFISRSFINKLMSLIFSSLVEQILTEKTGSTSLGLSFTHRLRMDQLPCTRLRWLAISPLWISSSPIAAIFICVTMSVFFSPLLMTVLIAWLYCSGLCCTKRPC